VFNKIMATFNSIQEMKNAIGITSISMREQFNDANASTNWAKHWDNDKRIAIIAHMDTIAYFKTNGDNGLFVKHETKTPEGKDAYELYTICKATNVVATM
jgi:hypothetical protein